MNLTSWCDRDRDFPWSLILWPWFLHDFYVISPWFFHDFSVIFPWFIKWKLSWCEVTWFSTNFLHTTVLLLLSRHAVMENPVPHEPKNGGEKFWEEKIRLLMKFNFFLLTLFSLTHKTIPSPLSALIWSSHMFNNLGQILVTSLSLINKTLHTQPTTYPR